MPCPLLSPGAGCWADDGQSMQNLNAKAALGELEFAPAVRFSL